MIATEQLSHDFDGQPSLRGVDLRVEARQKVVLLGSNGCCGKGRGKGARGLGDASGCKRAGRLAEAKEHGDKDKGRRGQPACCPVWNFRACLLEHVGDSESAQE